MTKYRVGDKVRVVAKGSHAHAIGDVVDIMTIDENDTENLPYRTNSYWVGDMNIEPIYETGTLAELNVRDGDLVECVDNDGVIGSYTKGKEYFVGGFDDFNMRIDADEEYGAFRIISRASDAPTDTGKAFGTLTEVEQLKIQLAHARGSVIESLTYGGEWLENDEPLWTDGGVYRIAELI